MKPAPKAINARLVDASEFRPKAETQARQPKPVPEEGANRSLKPKPKPAPKPVSRSPRQSRAPKVGQTKPEPKPEPRNLNRASAEEELRAIARQELAATLDAEAELAEEAAAVDEMSASFIALIQQTVINYWSRPPSARNGMEAELLPSS